MTLVLAMLLDAWLGEPRWLWSRAPHPAVLMGRLIGWADARFNRGAARRLKGVAVMVVLGLGALGLGAALAALGPVVEVIVAAILIAQRSLVEHVLAVAHGLRQGLAEGRAAVAMIVSRDTGQMDESAVARAAIESAAENMSDGVVAPLFWFAVAGLPGLLLYKITNTADSMIGYRTPRHKAFGWAAARFDDLLNLLPARGTAVLMALTQGVWRDWRGIVADAGLHRSPNAGWPEAAMARALGIALSGPRAYDGRMQDFPFVHASGRKPLMAQDIEAAVRVLWAVWVAVLCLALGLALL
ncbi:MAG: adenosylcobinamide-phosphate synthase CbiB [Paracoccaceae bacterium]|uniref:adenosylcobinamide-phosphate synthase CbiB n=1 Tax=unclassified Seohaeicola TaxID=2641111 RepID=UPI00237A4CCD|nr:MULTISPECIES: adenosylcobinamide-phosphate synthase CbiB [unclassified Seohaeicola]MDD9708915.1 adenosylcobinamide-phosphate synthase CbiB [Seohaeicola sp. 4SK31]MDD9737001.1 adenosylcobinamide-phosphate synthase CbiB [Seohaeicola sp. SP36]MDM7970379.1 adenosylcobinamide-phosphate synthase CbiB [Paracoccaceae bacterium]